MYHSLLWYITDVPPLWLEQIFTPFQVNKNKILLSTTLECNYLFLLLHCISEFNMYFWIYNVFLDVFYLASYVATDQGKFMKDTFSSYKTSGFSARIPPKFVTPIITTTWKAQIYLPSLSHYRYLDKWLKPVKIHAGSQKFSETSN